MTIPFLDLVRTAKEKFKGKRRSGAIAPLPSVDDKPQADKLAKRVMPNAVRTMTPEPTAPALAAASVMATRRISLNRPSPGVADDFGANAGVAVEPRGERAVSLALSDVIAGMPHGYLKQGENFDTGRRVTLKAVDVERGLATGRPSIAIAAIYHQVPEIFEHTVLPSDDTVVVLPFQKVIDELSHLRVRDDQTAETLSAQVETPFLKLMLEESAKFGTTVAPFETTELSIPLEPIASVPPAPEGAPIAGIRPSPVDPPTQPPPAPQPSVAPPVVQPVQPPPAARIPITPPRTIPAPQIATEPNHDGSMARITSATPADAEKNKPLPIGTGGSAFPRVPASSGPPVPPAAPASITPPSAVPTRIPFQLPPDAPPKVAIEKSDPSAPTVARVPAPAPAPAVSQVTAVAATSGAPTPESMVVLSLRPILQSLPPLQVAGDVASVPADVKVSFRMAAIAPQLASGKVVIPPKDFHAALPEQFRGLFLPDAVEAPVQLSLPDVLANLPGDSLRMREDQEVVRQDEMFETPFLAKAKEDAQRFAETARSTASALLKAEAPRIEAAKVQHFEAAKAEVATPKLPIPKVEAPKVEAPKVEASGRSDQFQAPILSTPSTQTPVVKPPEEGPKFDAKAAIAQACALSGVSHCSVNFVDGLIIAGNIPAEMHVEGLSAVAPTMLNKLQKYMCETQLGPLTCMTVYGEKSPVTFFSAGNLCLTAVHNGADLSAESRRELGRITQELSRTYPQTETPHVDH
jgi:predicted regulator of Ras-like GTPase activity (Roadblock/LC7/MglB family)